MATCSHCEGSAVIRPMGIPTHCPHCRNGVVQTGPQHPASAIPCSTVPGNYDRRTEELVHPQAVPLCAPSDAPAAPGPRSLLREIDDTRRERDGALARVAALDGALENLTYTHCTRDGNEHHVCNCSCESVRRIARAALPAEGEATLEQRARERGFVRVHIKNNREVPAPEAKGDDRREIAEAVREWCARVAACRIRFRGAGEPVPLGRDVAADIAASIKLLDLAPLLASPSSSHEKGGK